MLSDAELESRFLAYVQVRKSPLGVADLRAWRAALETCPAGHLCLESLWAECHLEEEDKLDLLTQAVSLYRDQVKSADPEDEAPDPFKALRLACMEYPERGDDIQEATGELVRFVDFQKASRWFSTKGPQGVNGPAEENLRLWRAELEEAGGLLRGDKIGLLQGLMRGRWELLHMFSSLASWSDGLGLTEAALADRVRDSLGLPHLAGSEVLEVRISEETVRSRRVFKKPTFADSGGYPPFLPSGKTDRYGYARDIASADLAARGGPEVWHTALPAREVSGLRLLGKTSADLRVPLWKKTKEYWDRQEGSRIDST